MINVFHAVFHRRLSDEEMERYLRLLPGALQLKIKQYRRWQDRQSALLGKLLLLEGLKETGGPPNGLAGLDREDDGRPRLGGEIDFNISHSEKRAVCAFTARGRVGIDLERLKPVDLADFRPWLTGEEWAGVAEAADPLREFYKIWTAKESVLKADGRGLSVSPLEIRLTGKTALLAGRSWFLEELTIAPDYLCHVASNFPRPKIILSERFF